MLKEMVNNKESAHFFRVNEGLKNLVNKELKQYDDRFVYKALNKLTSEEQAKLDTIVKDKECLTLGSAIREAGIERVFSRLELKALDRISLPKDREEFLNTLGALNKVRELFKAGENIFTKKGKIDWENLKSQGVDIEIANLRTFLSDISDFTSMLRNELISQASTNDKHEFSQEFIRNLFNNVLDWGKFEESIIAKRKELGLNNGENENKVFKDALEDAKKKFEALKEKINDLKKSEFSSISKLSEFVSLVTDIEHSKETIVNKNKVIKSQNAGENEIRKMTIENSIAQANLDYIFNKGTYKTQEQLMKALDKLQLQKRALEAKDRLGKEDDIHLRDPYYYPLAEYARRIQEGVGRSIVDKLMLEMMLKVRSL